MKQIQKATYLAVMDNLLEGEVSTSFLPIDTRDSAIREAGGIGLMNVGVAIAGAGAQTINLFLIEGCVQLKDLVMIITAVGDSTTFSNVKFEMWDANLVTDDLTTTVNGSGTVAGSKFIKFGTKAQALVEMRGNQVRVHESAFNRPFVEAVINSARGVDNYLRLSFTGDGATDITANVYVRWVPTCGNASMTVV